MMQFILSTSPVVAGSDKKMLCLQDFKMGVVFEARGRPSE
jgi:hypothetical protein